MTPIIDVLQSDHVNLALSAQDAAGAIEEVIDSLDGDQRITNYARLREEVMKESAPVIFENGCGICLAHGRTETVASLVMAAGRSNEGVPYPGSKDRVRFVFVAGIPGAFTSEYLRIVGAIVRMCRDKQQLRRLLLAKDAERFVALLSSGEVKL